MSSRSLSILLADDEPSVTQSLAFVLRHAGHHTESVADGAAAREKLCALASRYDLLITDHAMPVMDGLELVAKLRAADHACKIIVHSARVDGTAEQAYRALGVKHFLEKPFDVVEMRETVAKLAEEIHSANVGAQEAGGAR